jgi:FkbM family methyltransferase
VLSRINPTFQNAENKMTSLTLRLKSAVVGSPLDGLASYLRWLAQATHRQKHPELWEVYLEDRRLPMVLRRLLKPNSNAVDVGCHIGSFLSLLLSIAPDGRHTAIEPSRTKGAWLAAKFRSVEIINIAVSDREGRATFEENLSKPGYSKLLGDCTKSNNSYYDVDVKRLDDVIDRSVDLLKLDIEGNELAALRGGIALVQRSRPAIIFECGAEQDNRHELFDFITSELSYQLFTFGDFLFNKGPMGFDEFRKCGVYPFRAFNFVALPLNG